MTPNTRCTCLRGGELDQWHSRECLARTGKPQTTKGSPRASAYHRGYEAGCSGEDDNANPWSLDRRPGTLTGFTRMRRDAWFEGWKVGYAAYLLALKQRTYEVHDHGMPFQTTTIKRNPISPSEDSPNA